MIDITKEFYAVLLVLLATHFYEADRADVIEALTKPGSKARNVRGAMSVSLFRKIGRKCGTGTRRAPRQVIERDTVTRALKCLRPWSPNRGQ